MTNKIKDIIKQRTMIIDGAMGTQLQNKEIPQEAWLDENGISQEGCNELLNATASNILKEIHTEYILAGADLIKTNTFGTIPWVLDEYGMSHRTYELSKLGCQIVKELCVEYSTEDKPRFVLGSIGPGTKLPSLGHIDYDEMYDGYCECARGMVDGGVDVFLLETCQDPLQIKAAIHALKDTAPNIPIMVSATIELSGTMLIGTDAKTITTILEPFDILSLGFNCGTGPAQVRKHLEVLSQNSDKLLSIHSNAGLPQNRGGYTFYPMSPEEFGQLQKEFLSYNGVSFLGGCCGTTPEHIKALSLAVENTVPKSPTGSHPNSLASLFGTVELKQNPAPLLIGERSNATGSKAFRELLKAEDYEGTLSVGQQQVKAGAHVCDVSVGFAGRDETKDMNEVISRYAQKISIPLMPDSTQIPALETALKLIGGKAIINSVNLEDGIERFDETDKIILDWLLPLVKITDKLKKDRLQNGFDFRNDETKIELDNDLNIIKTSIEESTPSHSLIEDCMLLANKESAKILDGLGIFRTHLPPTIAKVEELLNELATIGIFAKQSLDFKETITSIQKEADEKNISKFVDKLIIKAQQQATYTHKNQGHFGLGFEQYSHFTSPIRRYSDLIVHRILKALATKDNHTIEYIFANIVPICVKISDLERNTTKVAQDYENRKFARWANKNIGNIFNAIVTSTEPKQTAHIENEKTSGAKIRLEDESIELFEKIKIKITSANIATKEIFGVVVKE